jgi:hypothetical protein
MQLEGARERIRELSTAGAPTPLTASAVRAQLEQIIESANELASSLSGNHDAAAMQARLLLLELESLKALLDDQQ